ncbi:MAG: hypothetical protein HRU19_03195 [Pseudobacteriovorax sp.]|nr:hypothetical protein [Pseudobacteriovorax sp.]
MEEKINEFDIYRLKPNIARLPKQSLLLDLIHYFSTDQGKEKFIDFSALTTQITRVYKLQNGYR